MSIMAVDVSHARAQVDPAGLEEHRRELTGYCYRMLGSAFEAEDAVQEVMFRALRAAESFAGRASVRSWLYRIATNVCLDMLRGRKRRAWPTALGVPSPPDGDLLGPPLPEYTWVSPVADAAVLPEESDPAEIAVARETIRLAFVTALQHLTGRQRAVLLLNQVLRFDATEIAAQLDTTVAAVYGVLQRARATLGALPARQRPTEVGPENAELLASYVTAFERYDIAALVSLLHADAIQSMPPFSMWLRGAADIGIWMAGPGAGCRSSCLIPAAAHGSPAFGPYRTDPVGGQAPWALQVLQITDGQITELHYFLDTARLFPLFGLPAHLPELDAPTR
jgi:RNA polymerase sigma-70 factor (ECF subfamily)